MEIGKNKNIDIQQRGDLVKVIYRWRSPLAYIALFFCVIWDLIVIAFVLAGGWLFISIPLLIGVAITWYTLGLLYNTTSIEADGHELRVVHGPIRSFSKNRTVAARDIQQLYLSEGGTLTINGNTSQLWRLMLELTNGNKYSLMGGMTDEGKAREIEHTLESHLGITDETRDERMEMPGFLDALVPPELRGQQSVDQVEEVKEVAMHTPPASEPSYRDPSFGQDDDFELHSVGTGARFFYLQQPVTARQNKQIDWNDKEQPAAHLITAEGETTRHIYAALLHDRWIYFEERPLDREESSALGFERGAERPPMLQNGDDRYYPGELISGHYAESRKAVEQVIYFTTRASTQFRVLREEGRDWQIYVQEPLDDSVFMRNT